MYHRDFKYNIHTQLYDITEGEVTYSMPLEITRLLKKSNNPSIRDWYDTELSKEDRNWVFLNGYRKKTQWNKDYPNG